MLSHSSRLANHWPKKLIRDLTNKNASNQNDFLTELFSNRSLQRSGHGSLLSHKNHKLLHIFCLTYSFFTLDCPFSCNITYSRNISGLRGFVGLTARQLFTCIERVAGRKLATFLSVGSIMSFTYCKLTSNSKVCKLCMTFSIQKDISCFYISTRKKETTIRKKNFIHGLTSEHITAFFKPTHESHQSSSNLTCYVELIFFLNNLHFKTKTIAKLKTCDITQKKWQPILPEISIFTVSEKLK